MKVLTRDEFNAHIRSMNLNERRSEGRKHVRFTVAGNGFQTFGILTDIWLSDEEIESYRRSGIIKVGETMWSIEKIEIVG